MIVFFTINHNNRACCLVAITRTTTPVTYLCVRSLQFIRRKMYLSISSIGTDLKMSYGDLTRLRGYQDGSSSYSHQDDVPYFTHSSVSSDTLEVLVICHRELTTAKQLTRTAVLTCIVRGEMRKCQNICSHQLLFWQRLLRWLSAKLR